MPCRLKPLGASPLFHRPFQGCDRRSHDVASITSEPGAPSLLFGAKGALGRACGANLQACREPNPRFSGPRSPAAARSVAILSPEESRLGKPGGLRHRPRGHLFENLSLLLPCCLSQKVYANSFSRSRMNFSESRAMFSGPWSNLKTSSDTHPGYAKSFNACKAGLKS